MVGVCACECVCVGGCSLRVEWFSTGIEVLRRARGRTEASGDFDRRRAIGHHFLESWVPWLAVSCRLRFVA